MAIEPNNEPVIVIPPIMVEPVIVNNLNTVELTEEQAAELVIQARKAELQSSISVFNSNFVAISLEAPDTELGFGKIKPNFLVVTDIFSVHNSTFQTATGPKEMRSISSYVKLVYREAIPQEGTAPSMGNFLTYFPIKEIVIEDMGNKSIPLKYIMLLSEHANMVGNKVLVDALLATFTFSGIFEDYVMKYDSAKSQEYIDKLAELKSLN